MDKRQFNQLIEKKMVGQACSADISIASFACSHLLSLLKDAGVDIARSNRTFTINGDEYLINIRFINMQTEHCVYASLETTHRQLPRTIVGSVDLFKVCWEYRGDEKIIESVILDNTFDDETSMAMYIELKIRDAETQVRLNSQLCVAM